MVGKTDVISLSRPMLSPELSWKASLTTTWLSMYSIGMATGKPFLNALTRNNSGDWYFEFPLVRLKSHHLVPRSTVVP